MDPKAIENIVNAHKGRKSLTGKLFGKIVAKTTKPGQEYEVFVNGRRVPPSYLANPGQSAPPANEWWKYQDYSMQPCGVDQHGHPVYQQNPHQHHAHGSGHHGGWSGGDSGSWSSGGGDFGGSSSSSGGDSGSSSSSSSSSSSF